MKLKGGDGVRKAEVKIEQCENLLHGSGLCKSVNLSQELIESKIEYGIEFQFEYFV